MLHLSLYKGIAFRAALIAALIVGAMGLFLVTGGSGEGQESGDERCSAAHYYCVEYPEGGSGAVISLTALDPEGEDVKWNDGADPPVALAGDDLEDFKIDGGRLTFVEVPDYEAPADEDTNNVYLVTIQATDDSAGLPDDRRTADRPVTRTVQVTVINVDEPGEVTIPTLQPQEDVLITVTLTDADVVPDGTAEAPNPKWQWSRSARATGGWTDIEDDEDTDAVEGESSSYTPIADDVGMYLRATATYTDEHGKDKTAEAISANPVQADPSNDAPSFKDGKGNDITSTTRSVPENSPVGTAVGTPVTATDLGFDGRPETLTYTLSTGGNFEIDRGTGQITTKTALDYENQNDKTHTLTVQATDPTGENDSITVNVTVTNVDEAPVITGGSSTVDYKEDTEFGEAVATYTATEPDGDDVASLKWTLSGRDAARFNIGNRDGTHGRLTFRESPDYEGPTDSDRNNVYDVTVEVTDRGGNKATRNVKVNVENVDEKGRLTVSSLHPQVGVRITPTLTDPDTPISNLIWTWEIGGNVESRASAYTPKPADANRRLEVSVAYTDGTGERRSEGLTMGTDVDARDGGSNQSPRFPSETLSRLTILENEASGENVGDPLTAEDPDNYDLTYSLSGGDSAFVINQDTGQITTTRMLDREKQSSYSVTITVEDPGGARDSHALTIAVEDVNEAPTITSGDVYIYYAENARGSVATYTAEDPEGRSIVWELNEADKGTFNLERGVLRFKNPPDFESDNDYTVTVRVSDSSADNTDEEEITIAITNVDEKGSIDLPRQLRVGQQVTATLEDLDGEVTGESWQWARSSSRGGGFVDIKDANSAEYTPVDEDAGKYLRVTVTYTDRHGGGKSVLQTSTGITQWKISGAPVFRDADGKELADDTPLSRMVKENSKRGTNVGAPVVATDISDRGTPERLTYALEDSTDANLFTIDSRTGQIKVKSGTNLDFEAPTDSDTNGVYVVMVTARDPSHRQGNESQDIITVNITVEDVDETPVLNLTGTGAAIAPTGLKGSLRDGYTYPEPLDPTTILGLTFFADDPETDSNSDTTFLGDNDRTNLTWTLTGPDADDFEIRDKFGADSPDNEAGMLRFKGTPDYEAPTDSGRNNVYEVTVQVADDAGNMASQKVKITVENVNEEGSVTFSHPQPQIGVRLTATLSDPDSPRGASSVRWQWYRGTPTLNNLGDFEICTDTNPTECKINRATSSSYTPKVYPDDNDTGTEQQNTDVGQTLTAVVTYQDGRGRDKVALDTTTVAVRAEPDGKNLKPEFREGGTEEASSPTRAVREDAGAGTAVGTEADAGTPSPVVATEPTPGDGDAPADEVFAYSLSGSDARFFTIDPSGDTAGQIKVAPGVTLDFETKKSYSVTVKATDPWGESSTIRVTIEVLDVDELPEVSRKGLVATGPGSVSYAENGRSTVAQYSALGPNAGRATWRVSGTDASDFSISSRGALTFRSTPDYERPADSDRDNVYEFTVTARSGREMDSFDVTVEVYNVDEEGEVTLNPRQGEVGAQLTAEVTDPDGDVTGISWEWARSVNGETAWTPIPGTDAPAYTIDAEDTGYFLQATAYYMDSEGGGKAASAATTASVKADDDGVVTLDAVRISVGDVLTATLTDPDGSITNQGWRWARSESRSSGWTDIQGATASTYTATASDVTYFLRVSVNYDDADGVDKTAHAVTARAVAEDDDGDVTLSMASPSVGDTVTATLSDPDGGVTGESWQWASSTDGRSNWANIADATSASYTVATGDLGKFLRVTVNYEDSQGSGKSAEAVTSAAVAADDDGVVTLSTSNPQVSDTITARLSDPDGTTTIPEWTWERSPNGTSGWTTVLTSQGATSTLQVSESHLGSYLRATASYTDTAGPGKSAQAVTSGPVAEDDDGMVALSTSAPEVGSAVTAMLSDPDNPRNLRWQWAKSANGSTWTDIDGATLDSYTPGRSDEGYFLRVTVTYDDSVGAGRMTEASASSRVGQPGLLTTYDDNGNGSIERREANQALADYFNGMITKEQALEVIVLYFSS